MRPLGDKVLIKPHPPENKTAGGIHIPESAKKRPGIATVVKVSEFINTEARILQEGDKILLSPDAGAPVIYKDEEHLMIVYADIWAIL